MNRWCSSLCYLAAWRHSKSGRRRDLWGCESWSKRQRGRLVADEEKVTDSRANGSATSGSAFIQSVLGGVQDVVVVISEIDEDAPDAKFLSGCVDARLEALFGIVDALFAPLVAERAPDVVDVPRRSAGGGRGEDRVEEHHRPAVDEETNLTAKRLVRAVLEVVEEVDEHLLCELDVIVCVHHVRRRQGAKTETETGAVM